MLGRQHLLVEADRWDRGERTARSIELDVLAAEPHEFVDLPLRISTIGSGSSPGSDRRRVAEPSSLPAADPDARELRTENALSESTICRTLQAVDAEALDRAARHGWSCEPRYNSLERGT